MKMDRRSQAAGGFRSADFVGRPPPTNEETVWIDDDYVFDLMVALSDLLYEDGCRGSSYLIERSIDLFLFEVGRTSSPKWRTKQETEEVPAEECANIFGSNVFAPSHPKKYFNAKTAVPRRVFQARRFEGYAPQLDDERGTRTAYAIAKYVNQTDQRQLNDTGIDSLLGMSTHPYTINVTAADPKVVHDLLP